MAETRGSPVVEGSLVDRASLPEVVHYELRRRILNDELVAGERLVESKLAEEFGVSRTTLRSALHDLANENLVEISKRRGCFVARMTASEVEDSCFARFLLEAGAACDNLNWITPEVLGELEAQVQRMKDAAIVGDMVAIVDADTEFHGIIVSAGNRRRVRELWHMLDGQMGSLMRSSLEHQGVNMVDIVGRHTEVMEALRSHRAKVIRQALSDHYVRRESNNGKD
ncbi:MAG: GntR family transcriptional regulator [Acidimicrobiales bacterium]|jgi:DNA-binding GntR family transcriptional regulator